mmetsp:Transcript_80640/g.160192  ORF Transcript_80640/g.160192 Transcript_80640/m.160192 type:complete len:90 (-) Transcript_80640:231-500(-)
MPSLSGSNNWHRSHLPELARELGWLELQMPRSCVSPYRTELAVVEALWLSSWSLRRSSASADINEVVVHHRCEDASRLEENYWMPQHTI